MVTNPLNFLMLLCYYVTVSFVAGQGYKSVKAKLGMKRVRPWKWMPFTNPARKDGAVFYHWRRTCDEGKEYPFAMFNKVMISGTRECCLSNCPPYCSME